MANIENTGPWSARDGQILGYFGSDQRVNIPNEIDGSVITEIGPEAFPPLAQDLPFEVKAARERIQKVYFPVTLQAIGDRAFQGCKNLNIEHTNSRFRDSEDLIIICPPDSLAARYASENSIPYCEEEYLC